MISTKYYTCIYILVLLKFYTIVMLAATLLEMLDGQRAALRIHFLSPLSISSNTPECLCND